MEVGTVRQVDIDSEMRQAYLDYAMSVIVSRALPDARDGLKPVHRRILYAMYDMGLRANSPYRKSARIVGEVLGKYHPHGDAAVYDAMVRMAQEFSMRYPLVDGQGNFGSIDGDAAAAMRYTEARMHQAGVDILQDLEKETIDFADNFDGSLLEPVVLPSSIPNLLVNGSSGIAVGMSTSIPPHNLGEVCDALIFMLDNWSGLDDVGLPQLMEFIKGPDFPTGGVLFRYHRDEDSDNLAQAYATGRGRVTLQAKAHVEQLSRNRNRIIITELPYQTNKTNLLEKIADLHREEKIEGMTDLRDESDRNGMRIIIDLTRTVDPYEVLDKLFSMTPMRSTFSIIMLALVAGEPRMLGLKQALRVYLEHRLTIVRRRSEYDLERARRRAHILESLRVALKNLDEVIALIRRSRTVETARSNLRRQYKLSEEQAQAILDMPLRRLAALERKKIEEEYKEVQARIKELVSLLRSPRKMRKVVAVELQEVKDQFGDPRRTQIVSLEEGESKASMLTATDLVPEKFVWVMVNPEGLISCTEEDRTPRPSGNDIAELLIRVNTRDTLYLISESGEAAAIPIHTLPTGEKPSEGTAVHKVSPLSEQDKLAAICSAPPKDERAAGWFALTVTRQGMVKKSALQELPGPAAQPFTFTRVNQGDRMGWVTFTDGKSDILLATAAGMAIRFSEEDVRPMGLVAAGVMGIKLKKGDDVVGVVIPPKRGDVFMIASDGTGKRVSVSQFPKQGRYGQGVIAWRLPRKVQVVGIATGRGTTRVTLHLAELAPKSARLDEAVRQGRAARGKQVQELKEGDRVVGLTVPWDAPRLVK